MFINYNMCKKYLIKKCKAAVGFLFSSLRRSQGSLCSTPGVGVGFGVRTLLKFLLQVLYLSYYLSFLTKLACMMYLDLLMDLKDLDSKSES